MKDITRHHDIFFANRLSLLRIWLCISTLFFTIETSFALNPSRYATQSQLADGYWVKVAVYESGIHQITYRELRRWGFSDPSAVTVFGYGGAMLPETFSENDIDDLNQLPVIRTDSKILFYAQGPTSWSYNEKTKEYDHEQNTYSTAGYYFLTDSKNQSATIAEREGGQTPGLQDITSFDEHAVYEQELYSPGSTGRLFLGDDFRYTTSKSFTFEHPGVDNSSPVKLRTSFGANILGGTASLVFTRNGQTLP